MNQPVKPRNCNSTTTALYGPQEGLPAERLRTFRRIKWGLMAFCLGVYYLLPFVRWNRGLGAPRSGGADRPAQ